MKVYTILPMFMLYLTLVSSSCQKDPPEATLANAIAGAFTGKAEGKSLSKGQSLEVYVEALSPNRVRIKGEYLPTIDLFVDELTKGVITQRNRYSDLTFIYLRNKKELTLTLADGSFSFEGARSN